MMKRREWVQLTDVNPVQPDKIAVLFLSTMMLAVATLQLAIFPAQAQDIETIKSIMALEADAEYGEYLAGECLTCHQVAGATEGIPQIAQRPAEYIVIAMLQYKEGLRDNEVMQLVASSLGQEELAALALFFSTLE